MGACVSASQLVVIGLGGASVCVDAVPWSTGRSMACRLSIYYGI